VDHVVPDGGVGARLDYAPVDVRRPVGVLLVRDRQRARVSLEVVCVKKAIRSPAVVTQTGTTSGEPRPSTEGVLPGQRLADHERVHLVRALAREHRRQVVHVPGTRA